MKVLVVGASYASGNVLVGCHGIHSAVRTIVYPQGGMPAWSGIMLWRGAVEWRVEHETNVRWRCPAREQVRAEDDPAATEPEG